MGKRISKVYTRTGDEGETGITGGGRVAKDDPRMEAIGDVDELNSVLGLVRCHELPEMIANRFAALQQELFNLGGELSMPGVALVSDAPVVQLEEELDVLNETLAPLEDFVMPGGSPAAAQIHVARAVCRRAERRLVTLSKCAEINPCGLKLINRLSDYLFVCARVLNEQGGVQEVQWEH